MAVAVRGYAAAPPGEPEQRIVMTAQDWPAYAWSFAIGDGTANVGFGMLLPSLRAAGRGGRAELHGRLAELLPGVEAERLVSHHLPLSTARPPLRPGPVLLAGDALSLINPLTGEGIFYALLSGRLAGAAAVTGATAGSDAGGAYAAALRAELGRHLRHTTLLARLTARPALVDAGIAAARRSPRAMEALVELGLGRGLITPALVGGLARQLTRSSRSRSRSL
jgi:flavin-dependent dehydrogenase